MRYDSGFTLIELVMIIILLGVLAAVATPRFTSFESRAAAQEVIEAIRYAQEMAMTHSGQDGDGDGNLDFYRFAINGNNFVVVRADADSTQNIPHPVEGTADYTNSWGGGVTFDGNVTIDFNARGLPSNGANVIINVTADGQTETIRVERQTGYARIL